jgi:hypothetical protein
MAAGRYGCCERENEMWVQYRSRGGKFLGAWGSRHIQQEHDVLVLCGVETCGKFMTPRENAW